MQASSMTIGELAKLAGVSAETIRYYQRLKLLDQPHRAYGSIRRYGSDTAERVQFIKRAQRLGFTLSEIQSLFRLDAKCDRQRAHQLAQAKITEIGQRVADLEAMRSALGHLVAACDAGNPKLPRPIVEAFRTGAA